MQKTRKKKAGQTASLQPAARQLFSQTAEPSSRASTSEAQDEVEAEGQHEVEAETQHEAGAEAQHEAEAEAEHEEASVPDADTVAGAEGRQDEHLGCLAEVEAGCGGTEIAPTCAHDAMEMDACGEQGETEQGEQDLGSSAFLPSSFECALQPSAFECELQSSSLDCAFQSVECASSPKSAIDAWHAAQELNCQVVSMSLKQTSKSSKTLKQDLLMHGKTLESLQHWTQHPFAKFKHSILQIARRLIVMLVNGVTVCAVLP